MRVALVTTWNERCGIAEYAKNLVQHVTGVDFKIVARPGSISEINAQCADCDIVHINYEPGLFGFVSPTDVGSLRGQGKYTVLTLHTSHAGDNRTPFTVMFDKVVVPEKTTEGFVCIPHGMPDAPELSSHVDADLIGTCGFPFPWKGFHQVAMAAELLHKRALVIAPESGHANTEAMRQVVMQSNPSAIYVTGWATEAQIAFSLSTCAVTVFAYQGGNYGISGAVRMGLAAGRPIVLTRNRQFSDLYDYEDEIEFIDSPSPEAVAEGVQRVLTNGKRPKKVLADMSWSRCAELYRKVYLKEL